MKVHFLLNDRFSSKTDKEMEQEVLTSGKILSLGCLAAAALVPEIREHTSYGFLHIMLWLCHYCNLEGL